MSASRAEITKLKHFCPWLSPTTEGIIKNSGLLALIRDVPTSHQANKWVDLTAISAYSHVRTDCTR